MSKPDIVFSQSGYPAINIYRDYFEIKEVNFTQFRKFHFSEIQKIKHYNPNNNFWMQLYIMTSLSGRLFSAYDPWKLKIYKKNGGQWNYKTNPRKSQKFDLIIEEIRNRIKETNANTT